MLNRNYVPVEKYNLNNVTEEEWLKLRTTGIGGSDCSAIMGYSPFTTKYDLFMQKTGHTPVEEFSDQMILDAGHKLENLVAQAYLFIMNRDAEGKEDAPKCRLISKKVMYQHPLHPVMQADVDRFIELTHPDGSKELKILEIKTTSNYNTDKWFKDGEEIVPPEYELQGRHYMSVMNIEKTDFVCLFCTQELRFMASIWNGDDVTIPDDVFVEYMDRFILPNIFIRHINRDDDKEEKIIHAEENFWNEYVSKNIAPPIDEVGDKAVEGVLKYREINDTENEEETLEKNEIIDNSVNQYFNLISVKQSLNSQIKNIDDMIRTHEANMINALSSDKAKYELEDGRVIHFEMKPSRKTSFSVKSKDLPKLKEQYPEAYEKFVSKTEYSKKLNAKLG